MAPGVEWLALAFTVTNSVRALFYVPQLLAVMRSVDGARNIALSTWSMWACNNMLGALYCDAVVGNAAMALSFLASFVGCGAMIATTLVKRRRQEESAPGKAAQG